MTKEQFQTAIDRYQKTGNLPALAGTFKELVLYMCEYAEGGFLISFLDDVPFIEKQIKELDFDKKSY